MLERTLFGRRCIAAAALCLVTAGTLALSRAVEANTITLRWTGTTGTGTTGTDEIEVSDTATETLTLDILLTAASGGIAGWFLSLEFDTDLGDELEILDISEFGWQNMSGNRVMSPLTKGVASSQESTSAQIAALPP